MHDFTTSLYRLIKEGYVDMHVAEQYAPHREALRSKIRGIDIKSDVLVSKVRG